MAPSPSAPARPQAVAFDMIGTVFPLDPLRARVEALGLPRAGLELWFATGTRDAFALAAAGDFRPFHDVLAAALDTVLAEQDLFPAAALREAVLAGMGELDARAGAAAAFALLNEAGLPVLALTNGAAASTDALLERAGLRGLVAHVVSIDSVERAKPCAAVYLEAARRAGVAPGALALVAAHPWDVNGAAAAGLSTGYLAAERPFAPTMRRPDWSADTLPALARAMLTG